MYLRCKRYQTYDLYTISLEMIYTDRNDFVHKKQLIT